MCYHKEGVICFIEMGLKGTDNLILSLSPFFPIYIGYRFKGYICESEIYPSLTDKSGPFKWTFLIKTSFDQIGRTILNQS